MLTPYEGKDEESFRKDMSKQLETLFDDIYIVKDNGIDYHAEMDYVHILKSNGFVVHYNKLEGILSKKMLERVEKHLNKSIMIIRDEGFYHCEFSRIEKGDGKFIVYYGRNSELI